MKFGYIHSHGVTLSFFIAETRRLQTSGGVGENLLYLLHLGIKLAPSSCQTRLGSWHLTLYLGKY